MMNKIYEYKANGEVPEGESLPPGLRRIALGVEYCGSRLRGFQKQSHDPLTVQETLEKALSKVAAEPVTLVCAGRTDAGVHATGQVIHFDTSAVRPTKAWIQGVNTQMPFDVRVHWAQEMPAQFHARFSARNRTYRYLIHSAPTRSAQAATEVTWSERTLDLDLMREGAQHLIGEHDFSSFRAAQCQARSPVRRLTKLDIGRVGQLIVLEVSATAFLHHMVRNIAGVLMAVGRGDRAPEWVAEVLGARDRAAAGVTAPPHGLYLVNVQYPEVFTLPEWPPGPLLVPLPLNAIAGTGR
ncbi:tRNA pseudouridine(38-40) synthase TruA [Microbulbifer harenosus]|uniref:tRNA pseudouridine synthase A n=1 Tax=Microbulbifer harenosus TaxID=2576840 RepID=A0ABY2UGQ3_9GAMM|nr:MULTISPECIES: tRNA pseudouridine(38-40) synthase TruA [Microbulbifer]QIL88625.1 tRNA pseudouridine(38-40) synthase TruA [Microbulbifer sp. SH-1]TLM76117.1 tRNA pseudouridine(38-40) synthase TruA [Microbulbifer harenosus]